MCLVGRKKCIYLALSSSISSSFFAQNFGAKAEMYLEKAAKKDIHTKNSYVKRWWNWHLVGHCAFSIDINWCKPQISGRWKKTIIFLFFISSALFLCILPNQNMSIIKKWKMSTFVLFSLLKINLSFIGFFHCLKQGLHQKRS